MQKEDLISLQPHLISTMQASLLGQENLLMPFHQGRQQSETADPAPALYVQATASGQACNKTLSVAIEGTVDIAEALVKPPKGPQNDETRATWMPRRSRQPDAGDSRWEFGG